MIFNSPFKLACFISFLICMITPSYGNQIFDVTKFGAVADGKTDNLIAFLHAWSAACKVGGSATLLVPRGTYLLSAISFKGPCANNHSPRVDIRGLLKAPANPHAITSVGWIEFRSLTGLYITGSGILDGQGEESWKLALAPKSTFRRNRPITLRLIKLNDAYLESLTLLNSKGFHMAIHHSESVQVRGFKVVAPESSPNTDGCHISGSKFVNISNFDIGTGDDCVSVGPGSSNITISGITCHPGHGISIGSLGKYKDEKDVVGVTVSGCTIRDADNGVRIKTWPGSEQSSARDLVFDNIIVNNVSRPIIIDQGYCSKKTCTKQPSQVQISNVLFRNIRGTAIKPHGVNFHCSTSVPCKNVRLEKIKIDYVHKGKHQGPSSFCSNILGNHFGGEMVPIHCQV